MRYEQLKFNSKKKVWIVIFSNIEDDNIEICSTFFSRRRALWEARSLAKQNCCLELSKEEWSDEGGDINVYLIEQEVY